MTTVVSCLERFSVYLVIAGALLGAALDALVQFYPIY
jgi:hypothetical protein